MQEKSDETSEVRTISLTDPQRSAVEQNNDFAFDLYRKINASDDLKGKSSVVSPLSVTYVMGMLNAGATGQTSSEITRVLGFGQDDKNSVNELCKVLLENSPYLDADVSLRVADMLVTNQPVSLSYDYSKTLTDYYDADVSALRFESAEAVQYVNDWCSRQTEGKIPSIVESLNGSMALFNAVYFKAPWSGKFNASDTHEELFSCEDGTQTMASMMHRCDLCYYCQGESFATLGLPYGNGKNWMMYVLLPNEGQTVDGIVSRLTAESWKSCVEGMSRGAVPVDVKLPRFKAQSEVMLNDILKQMGAGAMFQPRKEFSLMTAQDNDLFVGMVKQKAAIEVTEEGTEAAAVTAAIMYTSTGQDTEMQMLEFHATRPFAYLIQEKTTGAVFFIGTYRGE